MSPEIQAKIAEWRQKAVEGALTVEEMREAIKLIREDRVSAAQKSASKTTRKAAIAAVPSADDLLSELGSM